MSRHYWFAWASTTLQAALVGFAAKRRTQACERSFIRNNDLRFDLGQPSITLTPTSFFSDGGILFPVIGLQPTNTLFTPWLRPFAFLTSIVSRVVA